MSGPKTQAGTPSRLIVVLAGATFVFIAIYQTVTVGAPDKFTAGAILTLALGGGLGRVANDVIRSYVQTQIDAANDAGDRPGSPRSDEA